MRTLKSFAQGNLRVIFVATIVAAVCGSSFAVAGGLISGHDIKKGTIKNRNIHGSTIKFGKLNKQLRKKILKGGNSAAGIPGATGATGPQGATGATGPSGIATYAGPQWGIIDRNSYGSPVADLRGGPYNSNGSGPPQGVGSLGIEVDRTVTSATNSAGAEKVAFGDEVDFQGDLVSALNQIGFSVYATSENDTGPTDVSMPNITLEINPHVAGKTFTSMVYNPPLPTATSDWETYNAATTPSGPSVGWWFTNGSVATATNCSQAHFCTFAEAKSALAANQTAPATILTVAVSKGRDNPFIGAIDALQVNSTIYDFEPLGVVEVAAP